MHCKPSLTSATFVLLAALALIAAAGFPSLASASRSAGPGSAPQKMVTVTIRSFKFEPATVTVNVGDIVEWKNDDIVPHTATADGRPKRLLLIPAPSRREQRGVTSHGTKARTTTPAHSTQT